MLAALSSVALPGVSAAESSPPGSGRLDRTSPFCRRFLLASGIVWIGCEIAALAGLSPSPARLASILVVDPCCVSTVGGIFFLYLFFCPSWGRLAATTAVGLTLALGLHVLGPRIGLGLPVYNHLCLGLGLASLGGSILFTTGPARTEARAFLLLAAVLVGPAVVGICFLFLGIQVHPVTYDA
jgi:hypothetical protein